MWTKSTFDLNGWKAPEFPLIVFSISLCNFQVIIRDARFFFPLQVLHIRCGYNNRISWVLWPEGSKISMEFKFSSLLHFTREVFTFSIMLLILSEKQYRVLFRLLTHTHTHTQKKKTPNPHIFASLEFQKPFPLV